MIHARTSGVNFRTKMLMRRSGEREIKKTQAVFLSSLAVPELSGVSLYEQSHNNWSLLLHLKMHSA